MSDRQNRYAAPETYITVGEQLVLETADFLIELGVLGEHPPGNSLAVPALVKATFIDLGVDPHKLKNEPLTVANRLWSDTGNQGDKRYQPLVDIFRQYVSSRPDMDATYKAQFWRIVWQSPLIDAEHPRYPTDYIEPYVWQNAFRAQLEDRPSRDALSERFIAYHNQANEPRRYAGLKLAYMLRRFLFEDEHKAKNSQPTDQVEEESLVDGGTSAGLGIAQMIENIPFLNVRFNSEDMHINRYLENKLLGKLALDVCVGFDTHPMIDDGSIAWVENCSYYDTELGDPKKRRQRHRIYRALKRLIHQSNSTEEESQFKVVYGDLLPDDTNKMDTLENVKNLTPDDKYSVAAALTSIYEVGEDDQQVALERLTDLARDMVFVQDFAYRNPEDPSKLVFPGIYATPYRAFVRQVSDSTKSWHEFGVWDSGRCRIFTPSAFLETICRRQLIRSGHYPLAETD